MGHYYERDEWRCAVAQLTETERAVYEHEPGPTLDDDNSDDEDAEL